MRRLAGSPLSPGGSYQNPKNWAENKASPDSTLTIARRFLGTQKPQKTT